MAESESTKLEVPKDNRTHMELGAPMQDLPGSWDGWVAQRLQNAIVDQVCIFLASAS